MGTRITTCKRTKIKNASVSYEVIFIYTDTVTRVPSLKKISHVDPLLKDTKSMDNDILFSGVLDIECH